MRATKRPYKREPREFHNVNYINVQQHSPPTAGPTVYLTLILQGADEKGKHECLRIEMSPQEAAKLARDLFPAAFDTNLRPKA